MDEIGELLSRAAAFSERGEPVLLATLVRVRGSHYRKPGARMLLAADGELAGILSGGCLEGDLAERGRAVAADGAPRLVAYDLAAAGEALWGFGLGCEGQVEILLERLVPGSEDLLALPRRVHTTREPAALATVFGAQGVDHVALGERLGCTARDEAAVATVRDPRLVARLSPLLTAALRARDAVTHDLDFASGHLAVLVETLLPPARLLVCGTGRDAVPLVELARAAGWEVIVVEPRERAIDPARFAAADRLLVGSPRATLSALVPDGWTAAIVLTHAYLDDLALLEALLPLDLPYLGLLGPVARRERLLADLAARGAAPTPAQRARLHGPAGLDLGSRTPREIALAIVAEAQAALAGASAQPLAPSPLAVTPRLG